MGPFVVRRAWLVLVAVAAYAALMALLPEGPATLEAMGGVLAVPIVQLLILVAGLEYVPRWLRARGTQPRPPKRKLPPG